MKPKIKTNIELKREYWSQPDKYFTPKMVDELIKQYGDKPASLGEASYILNERWFDLLRALPIIGKFIK